MKNQLHPLNHLNLLNQRILRYQIDLLHLKYQKRHYYHLMLKYLKSLKFQIQHLSR
jgi:hypothetical protein